jgi:hypothetical protein
MPSIEAFRRKLASVAAERSLRNTPAWKPLQDYLRRTASTGCSYIDYWHLWRAVRESGATTVLELGTGASTIVLAHAAAQNGGRVISMEESSEWYAMAKRLLPSDLPVEVVLSQPVEDAFSIFRGVRYGDVPALAYDFVFVDGPGARVNGDITFDFDLIRIVERAERPLRAIIDKRVSTTFVMQRVLPGKVRYVPHLGLAFVDAVTRRDLRGIDSTTPSRSFSLATVVDFSQTR